MQGSRRQSRLQVERTINDTGSKLTCVSLFYQLTILHRAREMLRVHLLRTANQGDTRLLYGHIATEIQEINQLLFTLLLLWYAIRTYRADVRVSLYRYRNIFYTGLLIFLSFLLIDQVLRTVTYRGPIAPIGDMLHAMQGFSVITLPVAFVLAIFVTASNLVLMRREGRNWRNLLGCFLGVLLCFGTVFPDLLYRTLFANPVIDIHNQAGVAMHVELLAECLAGTLTSYLECVLLGTVVLGIAAAKRIPERNKDYMIILGCRMKDDGTPTPLLKGRVDKALAFAKQQEEE